MYNSLYAGFRVALVGHFHLHEDVHDHYRTCFTASPPAALAPAGERNQTAHSPKASADCISGPLRSVGRRPDPEPRSLCGSERRVQRDAVQGPGAHPAAESYQKKDPPRQALPPAQRCGAPDLCDQRLH